MTPNRHRRGFYSPTLAGLLALALCLGACTENTRRGAASGATTGAVASGLGTLVTGLVFNDGNLGERVARSAVYGATAGATAGAIAGSQRDAKSEPAQQPPAPSTPPAAPAEPLTRDKVLHNVGPKNVEALEALSACEHEKAVGLAQQAMQSMNRRYRQAALWIQSIAAIETGDSVTLDRLQTQLISNDPSLKDPATADRILAEAMTILRQDRIDQGRAPTCDVG